MQKGGRESSWKDLTWIRYLGGLLANDVVKNVQSILPNTMHVLIETAGHGLGMDTWEIAPLIRAVTSFLESL
jgi:hypothetical protein